MLGQSGDGRRLENRAEGERNLEGRIDGAEREAREKETKVLSLTRELDEAYEKIDDLEGKRKGLQNELDELANTQVSCNFSSIYFQLLTQVFYFRAQPTRTCMN